MAWHSETAERNVAGWRLHWRRRLFVVLILSCTAMPARAAFIVWIPDIHSQQSCWDLLLASVRTGFFDHCVIEDASAGVSPLPGLYAIFQLSEIMVPNEVFALFEETVRNKYGREINVRELFRALRDTRRTRFMTAGDHHFTGTCQRIAALQGNVLVMIGGGHVAPGEAVGRLRFCFPNQDGFALHARLGGVIMVPAAFSSLDPFVRLIAQPVLRWLAGLPDYLTVDTQGLLPGDPVYDPSRPAALRALFDYMTTTDHALDRDRAAAAIKPGREDAMLGPPRPAPVPLFPVENSLAVGDSPPANACPLCNRVLSSHAGLVEHLWRVHGKKSELLQFHPDHPGPWGFGGGPPPGAGGSGLAF